MAPAKRPTEETKWLPWLVSVMVVLLALLAWDWHLQDAPADDSLGQAVTRWRAESARSGLHPSAVEVAPVRPLASLDLAQLHDTVNRPLFEKRRRPPRTEVKLEPAPAPVIQSPEPDQNALTLLGIVQGERSVALLKRNQGGQNVRAEEGDVIDGWTIKRIDPQSVILSQGQRQVSLQLFRKRSR